MGWAANCLNSLFLQLCAEMMPVTFHTGKEKKKKSISITEIINIEIREAGTEGGQLYRGCLGQQQGFGTNLNLKSAKTLFSLLCKALHLHVLHCATCGAGMVPCTPWDCQLSLNIMKKNVSLKTTRFSMHKGAEIFPEGEKLFSRKEKVIKIPLRCFILGKIKHLTDTSHCCLRHYQSNCVILGCCSIAPQFYAVWCDK